MNITLRIFNTLLLAGILWMLFQIRVHMPPTFGEMVSADAQGKKALTFHRPFFNSVDIDNVPLAVEIDNTPLSVEIDNTPLDVTVVR
jgi:hypothetical protein